MIADSHAGQPARDCPLCPRLVAMRTALRVREATWHNAPVPSFGALGSRLLVVGLAPGVTGANRTGRPFTGDHAGELLYASLLEQGFARGTYRASPDDGLTLIDCRITNAVRCVPPENKPTPAEISVCRPFLAQEIAAMPRVEAVLCLGRVSHEQVMRVFGVRLTDRPFAHGAVHELPDGPAIFDSYHCSRYNTSTRRLTPEMFRAVVSAIRQRLDTSNDQDRP